MSDVAPRPPEHDGARTPAPEGGDSAAMRSLSDALKWCFMVLKIAMAMLVAVFFLQGFFIVPKNRVALVKRFGAFVEEKKDVPRVYKPSEGNLNYAIPVIEEVVSVDMTERQIDVDSAFWYNEQAVQKLGGGAPDGDTLRPGVDGYAVTGDRNILHSRWTLKYTVSDPYAFLMTFADYEKDAVVNPQTGERIPRAGPDKYLEEIFCRAVTAVTAGKSVDNALYDNVKDFTEAVQKRAEMLLDSGPDAGVRLTDVSLADQVPPKSTQPAFDAVAGALSAAASMVDKAEGESERLILDAEAKRTELIEEAKQYEQDLLAEAEADAESLSNLLARFEGDPKGLDVYLRQRQRQLVGEVLTNKKTYLLSPEKTWVLINAPETDVEDLTLPKKED